MTGRSAVPRRPPAPLICALCWAHAKRKLFELADVAAQLKCRKSWAIISPVAAKAVRRIDTVLDAERTVSGLEQWLRSQRTALARHNPVAGAVALCSSLSRAQSRRIGPRSPGSSPMAA